MTPSAKASRPPKAAPSNKPLTTEQVAAVMGCSAKEVRDLERSAIGKISRIFGVSQAAVRRALRDLGRERCKRALNK